MGIVLKQLRAIGPNRPDAEVSFNAKRQLIRGPSDTGKSYIRDCLWYMLGGDKIPKQFPLGDGYEELSLTFDAGENNYEIKRGIKGGLSAIYCQPKALGEEHEFELVDKKVGELLVELAGAAGRQILRSTSKKGPVTGDDVRHWALLSQTAVMSEDATAGANYSSVPQRIASFNLFLTGSDDAAFELQKTSSEVERIKGQLTSAEESLKRVQAGINADLKRSEVEEALKRVDDVLSAMTQQYDARASKLRQVRRDIADHATQLSQRTAQLNQSHSMISRFDILERKYDNDLERLGATREGAAFFMELDEVPCPLCGTPPLAHEHPHVHLERPERYQSAIAAEVEKISKLRAGLLAALTTEKARYGRFYDEARRLEVILKGLEEQEAAVVKGARIEFSADPKTLAERRSELSAQLGVFDEVERLEREIARLKKLKVRPRVSVARDGGSDGRAVADMSKVLLETWGFTDIANIAMDSGEGDLRLNDRPRLSYGAGKRALYLTALTISLMEHALEAGHPHLGTVVIDSPLKAYADPKSTEVRDVPVTTVSEKFFDWLSKFDGKGQIVILENESIHADVAVGLNVVEFVGAAGPGRAGFYPTQSAEAFGEAQPSNAKGDSKPDSSQESP